MQRNIFATPGERVKLLRRGISGTDIEKLYINTNSIFVLGVNWQNSHVTGTILKKSHTPIPGRHVSSPAGERCAVDLRENSKSAEQKRFWN